MVVDEDAEAAASRDGGLDGAIEQAGVQQVASHLKLPQLHGRAGPASIRRRRIIQTESQAFRAAAGFEKFIERRLDGLHAGLLAKAGLQRFAGFADDQRGAKVHGIARKMHGIGLVHRDPLRGGDTALNEAPGGGVESRRVVEERAIFQRTEAGIEMVEPRIDQPKRKHFHPERVGQIGVGFQLGAHAVCGPQHAAGGVPEGVSRAFEGQIGRQFVDRVAVRRKPSAKVRFFSAPFRMKEAAEDEILFQRQPRIGGENHVGPAWLRGDRLETGMG
jgi:hypothetical protein